MSEEITPFQVAPKTPLAGSAAAEIREQGEITRRSFPLVLTAAWAALAAALGGLASVLGRFMFPNVLFEPVQKFKAGLPADYSVGAPPALAACPSGTQIVFVWPFGIRYLIETWPFCTIPWLIRCIGFAP